MRQPSQGPKKRARAPDLQPANDEAAADYALTEKTKKTKTRSLLTQKPEDCPDCHREFDLCQCIFMYVDCRPGVRPRDIPDRAAPFTGFLVRGTQVKVTGQLANSSGEWGHTTVGYIRLEHLREERYDLRKTGLSTGPGDE